MIEKPTYKELEQRVKELDDEVLEYNRSEEELERIFNFSLDMIGTGNLEGYFTKINSSFGEILGYTEDEFLKKPFISFVHKEDVEKTAEALADAGKGKRTIFIENRYKCKDGSYKWIEWKVQTLSEENKFIAVGRDIAERKQAEEELKKHREHLKELVAERTKALQNVNKELQTEIFEHKQVEKALQESEEKYRSLFETSKDAIMTLVPPDWNFTSGNQSTIKMFKAKDEQDFTSKSPWELSPEYQPGGQLSADKAKKMIEKAMTTGSNYFEWTHKNLDGEEFPATVLLSRGEREGKQFLQAVVRNITERKQAKDLIHSLSRQLITSQESERQMISYELHDSVAQDLSSSRITCEMLLKYKSLTPGARKQISKISGNLQKILKSVRDLSYELRPPGLEDLGLAQTMYQFCEDFSEKTGVRVDFQSAGIDDLDLNYNTKINLYRLLQEGLNNVKKHADASNVKVRLISSFPNVILRIYDDGKGFDFKERLAKTSSEKKMGLSSMAHRVDLLLGRMDIESIPGRGTKVFIEIPQQDEKA